MLLVMSAAGTTLPSTTCSVTRFELKVRTVVGADDALDPVLGGPGVELGHHGVELGSRSSGVKNWSMVAPSFMVNMTTMACPPKSFS